VHCTDDRLTSGVDVHVLDCNLLLAFAAIALQGLELRRGSHELDR
jgi:hypothetical protein